jgi:hypothetical protein
MEPETRMVELNVGVDSQGVGQGGEWYTMHVHVPIDTPEEEIPRVAITAAEEKLKNQDNVAFIGVYNVPELTDGEDDLWNP